MLPLARSRLLTDRPTRKLTRKGVTGDRIDKIRGRGKRTQSDQIDWGVYTYILLTILARASGWSPARQSPPAGGGGAPGSTPPAPAAGSDPWVGRQLASMARIGGWRALLVGDRGDGNGDRGGLWRWRWRRCHRLGFVYTARTGRRRRGGQAWPPRSPIIITHRPDYI